MKKPINDIREMYGLPRIEDKKIEKLDISNGISVANCACKINEIIDYINKEGK